MGNIRRPALQGRRSGGRGRQRAGTPPLGRSLPPDSSPSRPPPREEMALQLPQAGGWPALVASGLG